MGGDELPRSRRALTACVLGAALIWSRAASPATSFIPIPEIITDPNEGNTGGLLGVVLFLDEKDEIRYMLAPDVRYNRPKGVFPSVNLSYRMRIRRFSVERGQVRNVPFIGAAYPNLRARGLFDPAVHWAHQVALTYDSRDSFDIPTHGALALAYLEMADRRLGSSTSFVKFGGGGRGFVSFWESKPLLAPRVLAAHTRRRHTHPRCVEK